MSWITPIGEARTNLLARHHEQAVEQARLIARIANETSNQPNAPTFRPAGDERTLRGIPAIGRNVAGVISGTNPESSVIR